MQTIYRITITGLILSDFLTFYTIGLMVFGGGEKFEKTCQRISSHQIVFAMERDPSASAHFSTLLHKRCREINPEAK